MFDFEATMKLIVALGIGGFVLIMFGVGIKVLFFRKSRLSGTEDPELLEGLDDRLLRTEAKVNELEERLDFAERMLGDVRAKGQLPGKS